MQKEIDINDIKQLEKQEKIERQNGEKVKVLETSIKIVKIKLK